MGYENQNASKINGIKVDPTAPTDGQGLVYDSATDTWIAADVGDTGLWSRDAGNGYLYPTTLSDNVGVGTATPPWKFTVQVPTNNGLVMSNSAGNSRAYFWLDNFDNAYMNIRDTNDAAKVVFYAVGVSYVNGGNFGVNTTTPRRKLDVLDSTDPAYRNTHTDNTIYSEWQTNASGHAIYIATGDRWDFVNESAVRHATISNTGVACGGSNPPRMVNTSASATVPNFLPLTSDNDTGVGRAGEDQLSLIAGGEEGIRLVQDTWGCSMHIPEITTPTAVANYGAVYTKSDNKLYFQDGAGTEHEIAFV